MSDFKGPSAAFKSLAGKKTDARTLFEKPMSEEERMALFFARIDAVLDAKDAEIAALKSEVTGKAAKIKSLMAEAAALHAAAERGRRLNLHQGPILMIDASGSMAGKPLQAALAFAKNDPARLPVLWSDKHFAVIDTADRESMSRMAHGLHGGSDFAPALETIAALHGPRHVVVITDGDFHLGACQKRAEEILSQNPGLRLDFITMNTEPRAGYTPVADFISTVQVPGANRPRLKTVTGFDAALLEAAMKSLPLAGKTAKRAPAAK